MKKKFYRLIPMNMDIFNIDDLKRTLKAPQKQGIKWINGSEDGKYAQDINIGDIVYIYCTNLTDGSRRILFRAEVVDVDGENEYTYDANKKIKAIYVKKFKVICLNDKIKYSKEKLEEVYGLKINQTKRKLASFDEYNEYLKKPSKKADKCLKLVADLEKEERSGLSELEEYFNDEILCECCQLLKFSNSKAKSRTFKKTNGFTYYENHHLLMQNILSIKKDEWFKENKWYKKKELDKKMVLDDYNVIVLCPVCHREFHYGDFIYNTSSDIKNKEDLIKQLMKKHNFDKNLKQYGKSTHEIKAIKEYIINQYIPNK